ncbi:MAG: LysR family transcriptional regulator [Oscillospiraceae bacterium]|nr:LysR family transcriptional regulator [Oscillospiraceae bacterium]
MNSNITFQQIEAFLAVARYKSITRACEALFISQPALSKILKRFEENIGVTLFERTNHGAFLTAVGKLLYSSLEPLYNSLDSTLSSVQHMVGPEDRFLHIALPSMFDICEDFEPLRALIRQFKQTYPEIRVIKTIMELNRLQNMLSVGFVNLVIAPEYSLSPELDANYQFTRLNELKQYVTMADDHPLAGISPDEFHRLNDQHFLAVPYQGSLYSKDLLNRVCHQNGIEPGSMECPPNVPTLLHGLEMEKYVTVFWKTTAENGKLVYIPLPRVEPPLRAVIAWSPDRLTRAASLFLDML